MAKEITPDKYFYLCDGGVIRSFDELSARLREMEIWVFEHHVNAERNDFASWVRDVFGKKSLAEKMSRSGDREGMIDILKQKRKSVSGAKKDVKRKTGTAAGSARKKAPEKITAKKRTVKKEVKKKIVKKRQVKKKEASKRAVKRKSVKKKAAKVRRSASSLLISLYNFYNVLDHRIRHIHLLEKNDVRILDILLFLSVGAILYLLLK